MKRRIIGTLIALTCVTGLVFLIVALLYPSNARPPQWIAENDYFSANGTAVLIADPDSVEAGWRAAEGFPTPENPSAAVIWEEDEDTVYALLDENATVFGGIYDAAYNGNTSLLMTGGKISALFGGSIDDPTGNPNTLKDGCVNGSTSIQIQGGQMKNVYGGGFGDPAVVKRNTSILLTGGEVERITISGREGLVNGTSLMTMRGGTVGDIEGTAATGEQSSLEIHLRLSGGTITQKVNGIDIQKIELQGSPVFAENAFIFLQQGRAVSVTGELHLASPIGLNGDIGSGMQNSKAQGWVLGRCVVKSPRRNAKGYLKAEDFFDVSERFTMEMTTLGTVVLAKNAN